MAIPPLQSGLPAAGDALVEADALWAPLEAGLFDYNRLENR